MNELIRACPPPCESAPLTPEDACAKPSGLQKQNLHEFAGVATQKLLLAEVLKLVQTILAGRTPEWPAISDGCMPDIKVQFGMFVQRPPAGVAPGGSTSRCCQPPPTAPERSAGTPGGSHP